MSDLRKGAANIARTGIDIGKQEEKLIPTDLRKAAFQPIDVNGDDERSAGFVEFESQDSTEFSKGAVFHGMHALFAYRVDRLKVPNSKIRKGLLEWAQGFEQRNGRAPGRRERAEQKEALKKLLRKTVEPTTKVTQISIDLEARELMVWTASRSLADEVQAAVESALDARLTHRVPAALVPVHQLDTIAPTPLLFGAQS